MAETKKIKTALVSVFHKDGLDELLAKLNEEGVKFLSTGGTQKFIESLGYECQKVEDVTTYPSILGGRVKTLHPKIFGGILARRDNEGDQEQMKEYEIPSIDLVIVDLYPFEQTVASGASDADIIEKIDIGGPSMVRGAAKNFASVAVVVEPEGYAQAARAAAESGGDPAAVLEAAATAAEAGAAATEPLRATKGRASYLGERSIGHLDPGAVSTSLILRAAVRAAGEAGAA